MSKYYTYIYKDKALVRYLVNIVIFVLFHIFISNSFASPHDHVGLRCKVSIFFTFTLNSKNRKFRRIVIVRGNQISSLTGGHDIVGVIYSFQKHINGKLFDQFIVFFKNYFFFFFFGSPLDYIGHWCMALLHVSSL